MAESTIRELLAYAVGFRDDDHETIINARSRGQAKMAFLRGCDWLDPAEYYTAVFARVHGPRHIPETTDALLRVAASRGVPFVRAGMRVCVGEDFGVIVEPNCSANFNVMFDPDSQWPDQTLNCHPLHDIAYFNEDGKVIQDFRKTNQAAQ